MIIFIYFYHKKITDLKKDVTTFGRRQDCDVNLNVDSNLVLPNALHSSKGGFRLFLEPRISDGLKLFCLSISSHEKCKIYRYKGLSNRI